MQTRATRPLARAFPLLAPEAGQSNGSEFGVWRLASFVASPSNVADWPIRALAWRRVVCFRACCSLSDRVSRAEPSRVQRASGSTPNLVRALWAHLADLRVYAGERSAERRQEAEKLPNSLGCDSCDCSASLRRLQRVAASCAGRFGNCRLARAPFGQLEPRVAGVGSASQPAERPTQRRLKLSRSA